MKTILYLNPLKIVNKKNQRCLRNEELKEKSACNSYYLMQKKNKNVKYLKNNTGKCDEYYDNTHDKGFLNKISRKEWIGNVYVIKIT